MVDKEVVEENIDRLYQILHKNQITSRFHIHRPKKLALLPPRMN